MKSLITFTPFAWLVSSAFAHSIFQELYLNGVSQGHEVGIRVPDYDGVGINPMLVDSTLTSSLYSQSWT